MSQKTRAQTALDLLNQGELIKGGTFIPVERFEEVFEFKRDSQEFNWLISSLRKALYEHGLYLSGEGVSQSGGYEILPPSENFWVAKLAMARAERDLTGKELLLANTDLSTFSELQKARHESTLRVLSLRLSALRSVRKHNEKTARKRKEIVDSTEETEE